MIIVPHRSIGLIRFGMTPLEVAHVIRQVTSRRQKGRRPGAMTEHLEPIGLSVHYWDDKCVAVSVSEEVDALYEDIHLFAISARAVRRWACARAGGLDDDVCGFLSKRLGLSMTAPWIDVDDEELRSIGDDPERPAQSFTVFSPGYYDSP